MRYYTPEGRTGTSGHAVQSRSESCPRALYRALPLVAVAACGLAVFGTNSEANSQSVSERMELLEAGRSGPRHDAHDARTGCCALTDTVRLTAHAVQLGCAGVLMLPPFYYKDVSDEGLYRTLSDIIQRVGDARLRIYLYHIPPVAVVGISLPLIERLLKAYPGTIAGIKDSSGNWQHESHA